MLVCLKLILLSRYENRMMSWDPLIHSIWKRCTTKVDTTINRCNCMRWQTDGMTEYKLCWSDSCRCLFHSVQNALNYGSCSNGHLSWTRLSKSYARRCRNTSWLARSTIAFSWLSTIWQKNVKFLTVEEFMNKFVMKSRALIGMDYFRRSKSTNIIEHNLHLSLKKASMITLFNGPIWSKWRTSNGS